MTKRREKTKKFVKSMKDAKASLMLKIEIGDFLYEFERDVFDLNHNNIGILNEQICNLPAHVAFIVEAVGEVEKELDKKKLIFEIWKGEKIVKYFNNPKDYKSEQSKMNALMKTFPKEFISYEEDILNCTKLVRVLKSYEKGIDAKMQLAQTLSANIRTEREVYARDYDKPVSGRL